MHEFEILFLVVVAVTYHARIEILQLITLKWD